MYTNLKIMVSFYLCEHLIGQFVKDKKDVVRCRATSSVYDPYNGWIECVSTYGRLVSSYENMVRIYYHMIDKHSDELDIDTLRRIEEIVKKIG
ncbi:hypothetical protein SBFV2_gp03 [Sulfolobales Beppu filamentous virus 2]|uniref:Uncharacterized protein n=1 Tax=Sulfolobales Beppu filamentous virus 2 TaxID=2493123 RepID=A0A3Q8Q9Q5_9VIRU|nr:hypothetical protein HOU84_gp03 [Sulfolobales Beppu filamentous virus 2]AZI75770.1 hypothetical protein SBFV2_gp03 [Sulfolobales Beppu filamentous virus 2]